MEDRTAALRYLPILHFDRAETIPLRAVGYAVLRRSGASPSFRRYLAVPEGLVVEYQYYWDYDIQHMYDLEHIWVYVNAQGQVYHAEGSFHGRYMNLLVPGIAGALPPENGHVHAFCQPGKHAFLPAGALFGLLPDWKECCNDLSGGDVLVGGPFLGRYFPTPGENARSRRYIRRHLAFAPTLDFAPLPTPEEAVMPWEALYAAIPGWIAQECARLKEDEL